jgi:hypothetical protein
MGFGGWKAPEEKSETEFLLQAEKAVGIALLTQEVLNGR